MPLIETLPVRRDTAQWSVWGTVARIVVTDPALLAEAAAIVVAELAAVDAACSRFRADSELSAACRAGGRPVTVSPLLADLVGAALDAARRTGGDVDPTIGAALCGLGYDRDFAAVTGRDIAASLGPEAVRLQARTFARLVHGQIAETAGARGADPIEHYLSVIAEKTASLIATSARFGGLFSGVTPEQVEALTGYGETIGIAFQLSDDLLDIASESVQSGKTPGTDLREGVPTLPVLYALAGDDTDASAVRLRELLSSGPLVDDVLHAEALGLLRESAAMKRARETVRTYAEEARSRLAPLPEGSPRSAIEALCDFIADRTS